MSHTIALAVVCVRACLLCVCVSARVDCAKGNFPAQLVRSAELTEDNDGSNVDPRLKLLMPSTVPSFLTS